MEDEHDLRLRQAAFDRIRELSHRYTDLVPLNVLRDGFAFDGGRVSFGSFMSGIFRPREMHGPAALALVTAPPATGKPAPYEDTYDEAAGRFTYRFRDPGSASVRALAQAEADNHKLRDRDPMGVATVINGLALCAIHHLAYDRNLIDINPDGVVHIHERLLHEIDGPMLKNGLQHFHGAHILQPARKEDRPDRERLAVRFESFQAAA